MDPDKASDISPCFDREIVVSPSCKEFPTARTVLPKYVLLIPKTNPIA